MVVMETEPLAVGTGWAAGVGAPGPRPPGRGVGWGGFCPVCLARLGAGWALPWVLLARLVRSPGQLALDPRPLARAP